VIVGAGLSISSRFPDTAGLTSLLWDALDIDPITRKELALTLGRLDASAKELVGDNEDDIQAAWAAIASSTPARERFQKQFAALDAHRSTQPSPAHEALAHLIHAGAVECVVSLNWDTALESAYVRLYGTSLPDGLLFKPHGDAARSGDLWIFPHESGFVPPEVTENVIRLGSEHARILLVIGYSESDRVIVDELIKPLDRSWRTVRVGPGATGSEDLTARAEVAIPLLAESYADKEYHSSWHTVPFSGRRGIESALKGERLGPQDVDSCPELSEVEMVVKSLRADKAVVLNGPTGSGKSITAYQALHRLTGEGFETLRLCDDARQRRLRTWLTDSKLFPHKKVLLIDDAQDLSPDTVRELCEAATPDSLVLVVGIDHVAGGVQTIRLSARSAVARLSQFVRKERVALFPLIRDLDDYVGNNPDGVIFDRRIDAAEGEKTCWQFFYHLTGGWRRIRRAAIELRDDNRADLALLAVAVAQIAGIDAGVRRSELSTMLSVLGQDEAWLDRCLNTLRSRRLVTETDGLLRCTHLRAAYNMVAWMLHPPEYSYTPIPRVVIPPIVSAADHAQSEPPAEPSLRTVQEAPLLSKADTDADCTIACKLVEVVLDSPDTPLRGCTWLSGRDLGLTGNSHRTLVDKGVLSPERCDRLAHRALLTPADGDVAAAAELLSETVNNSPGSVMSLVRAHVSHLSEWYGHISPENGWALGDLVENLNVCDDEDRQFAPEVAGYTDTNRLANLILDGGWPYIYSTSDALNKICSYSRESFRKAVAARLDEDAFKRMLSMGPPDLGDAAQLIGNIALADHDLSLRLLEYATPTLAHQFDNDPIGHWSELVDGLVFTVFRYDSYFLAPKDPPAKCRRVAQSFIRALNRQRIAEMLAGPFDHWGVSDLELFVRFLSDIDPTTFADIANSVDLVAFETSLRSHPKNPDRTALFVCANLWEHRPDPVHDILDRLEPDLAHLDLYIVYMAPDVACRALRRGVPLDLALDLHSWEWAATVLARLHQYDPQVALEVAHANREGVMKGLVINMYTPLEGLNRWVSVCDEIAPGLIDSVISELPKGAVAGWACAIARPPKRLRSQRKEIAPLVHRAERARGHVQTEAKALLARFPALAHEGLAGTTTPEAP